MADFFSGELRPYDSAAAISSLISSGEYRGDIFLHGKHAAVFSDTDQEVETAAFFT